MRVYNTMTRGKEELVPVTPGEVRMYVCGVTPYDYSHIGHARSAVAFDVIRRWLAHKSFRVTTVRNYTDVDDKIINRANQEAVSANEIAQRYIDAEARDMEALGVKLPTVAPKATEHIDGMIALIERLIAKGVAYVVDGDVYFEIRRFPPYGKLSGKNLEDLLAGARVEVDERKRDPRDFALWKAAKPGEPSWPSPWGPGRPGWHVECSVMATRYLGQPFDIHGGGTDLIFPHHECEIAQSEADRGAPFAKYWLHNGMVNFGAEKMSKSLGNTLTIRAMLERHDREALRLWMLGTHYRNQLEWSEERVHESARALSRLTRLVDDASALGAPAPSVPTAFAGFDARFGAAMDDDVNTPQALAVLFDFARALSDARDRGLDTPDARAGFVAGVGELVRLARVLGLLDRDVAAGGPPAEVERLVAERVEARARRDFRRSDELRVEIQRLGWLVEDTPSGPRLTRKSG
ncbi:MAG TPA: cysteine--tRNA ligase [Methylomirabilota bacterium]|nr:cysteine--tRNA ligase [Methylomirabilota bacterium]